MHSGKSLRWFAHPNYEHGLYSKYSFEGTERRSEQARRKRARERVREIQIMSQGQLLTEMRRLFGPSVAKDIGVEEFREMLVIANKAATWRG
jgi:hypothetical protein